MNFLVVYYSKGGKTRKVAEAIGEGLGCKAVDADTETLDISGTDVLVVGSGTYGGLPGPKLVEFLKNLPQTTACKAAIFATSAGPSPKSIPNMKGSLEGKGYSIVSSFECRGKFLAFNRGRPNDKDLENAKAFGDSLKKMASQ